MSNFFKLFLLYFFNQFLISIIPSTFFPLCFPIYYLAFPLFLRPLPFFRFSTVYVCTFPYISQLLRLLFLYFSFYYSFLHFSRLLDLSVSTVISCLPHFANTVRFVLFHRCPFLLCLHLLPFFLPRCSVHTGQAMCCVAGGISEQCDGAIVLPIHHVRTTRHATLASCVLPVLADVPPLP